MQNTNTLKLLPTLFALCFGFGVMAQPAVPVVTNASRCGSGTVVLKGKSVTAGVTYRWYTVATGGQPITGATDSVFTTPVLSATTSYWVSAKNATTESGRAKVTATVTPAPKDLGEQTLVTNGLTSWYPLDNTDPSDKLGYNNGTLQGNPTSAPDRFGNPNKALRLNGTNSYISTSRQFTPVQVQTFSVSIWFKTNSTTGGNLIGFTGLQTGSSTTQNDRKVFMTPGGKLGFMTYNNAYNQILSSASYNDNVWHLAVATFDAANGGMKFYVDGVLLNSLTTTTAQLYSGYWKIGFESARAAAGTSTGTYFKGDIDDVRGYSRALTAPEVSTMYKSDLVLALSANSLQFCGITPAVKLALINSQPGVKYRLVNMANGATAGATLTGNGDTLKLLDSTLAAIANFKIYAQDTTSKCDGFSAQTIKIAVGSGNVAAPSDSVSKLCSRRGTYSLAAKGGTGYYSFYSLPTGGTPFAQGKTYDASITPGDSAVYYAASVDTASGCESQTRALVKLVTKQAPLDLQTGGLTLNASNLSFCGPVTVKTSISLSKSQAGIKYAIFSNAVQLGTKVIGNGATITLFNDTLRASTNFTITATDTVSGCVTVLDTVIKARLGALPPVPVVAGAYVCANGPAPGNLLASGNPVGTYLWYSVPTGGAFISKGAAFTTSVLANNGDSAVYYVSSQDTSGCESARVKVKVVSNSLPNNLAKSPAPNKTGLITWFDFNGNVLDKSGATPVNNGTAENLIDTTDRQGLPGKAYYFNGTNARVYTRQSYFNPAVLTISAWFKTTTTNGGNIVAFGDQQVSASTNSDRKIFMTTAGKIGFLCYYSNLFQLVSANSYNDGKWHNATATLSNQTGPDKGMRLYVDGVQVGSNNQPLGNAIPAGYWKVGWEGNTGVSGTWFEGAIDEVRIYNRILSGQEITGLFEDTRVNLLTPIVCGSGSQTTLEITNTQPQVKYQLFNKNSQTAASAAIPGNRTTLTIRSNALTDTLITIVATDTLSGCKLTLDTTLKIKILPNAPARPRGTAANICGTSPITYTASGSTNSYKWYDAPFGGNLLASGANYTATVNAGDSLTVYVSAITTAGCESVRLPVKGKASKTPTDVKVPSRLGLQFYYPFNGNADDASQNATPINARNIGATDTTDRFGNPASAYYLKGDSETVRVPQLYTNPTVFSFSLWFKTSQAANGVLLSFNTGLLINGNASDRILRLRTDGKLEFQAITNRVQTGKAYTDDNWHHVVLTFGTGGTSIYVDGSLDAFSGTLNTASNFGGYWRFGAENGYYYKGLIDDIRYYNRIITTDEIALLFLPPAPLKIKLANQSACGNSLNPKIALLGSEAGVVYQLINTAGNVNVGNPITGNADSIAFTIPAITQNTVFRIQATNPIANCSIYLDSNLRFSVTPLPALPVVKDTIKCGPSQAVVISASGAGQGQYRWYTVPSGGTPAAGTNNTYTTPRIRLGIADSFYVALNINGCEGPRARIIVRIDTPLSAPVILPTGAVGVCAGDSITYTGPAGVAQYFWTSGLNDDPLSSNRSVRVSAGISNLKLVVKGLNGCLSAPSVPATVTVVPRPTRVTRFRRSYSPPFLAATDSNRFQVTYKWLLNGRPVVGQDSSILRNPANGVYRVIVVNSTCLSDTSDTISYYRVGVEGRFRQANLELYPNPTKGTFVMELNSPFETAQALNVEITDVLGKTIISENHALVGNFKTSLDISSVPAGIYYLKARIGNEMLIRKMLKE